jgi:tetratricopeptide (TPR) repeat protein
MGNVLLSMNRPQEAIVAFDEALRRAPDELAALRGKVQALEAAKRRPEAAALAQRVHEVEAHRQADPGVMGQEGSAGAERIILEADEALVRGDGRAAIERYLAAAAIFTSQNAQDAALDACLRALEIEPGAAAVHLAMAGIYLRRGWRDLAVERLVLLDRLLQLTGQPAVREGLQALAREHRAVDPELERLAASGA